MKKNTIIFLSAIFITTILSLPIKAFALSNVTLNVDFTFSDYVAKKEYFEKNLETWKTSCSGYSDKFILSYYNNQIWCYNMSAYESLGFYVESGESWTDLVSTYSTPIPIYILDLTGNKIGNGTASNGLTTFYSGNNNRSDVVRSWNDLNGIFLYVSETLPCLFQIQDNNKLIINGKEIEDGSHIYFDPNYKDVSIKFTPTYYTDTKDIKSLNITYNGYPTSYVNNVCYYRSSNMTDWEAVKCSDGVDLFFTSDFNKSDSSILGDKDSIFYEAKIVENGEIVAYNIFNYGDNGYSYGDIFYITQKVDYPNSLEFIFHYDNNRLPSPYVKPICYYMKSTDNEWIKTPCSSVKFTMPTNNVTYSAKIEYNGVVQDYVYYDFKYNPLIPGDTSSDDDSSIILSFVDKFISKIPIFGDVYKFFDFFISYTPPEYEEGYSPIPPIDFTYMGIHFYAPMDWSFYLQYRPTIFLLMKLTLVAHYIIKLWHTANKTMEKGMS